MKLRTIFTLASVSFVACSLFAQTLPSSVPATNPTTQPTTLPTAQAVIDRYVAVTGGAEAYASLKSRRAEGTVSMADLGIEGTIQIAIRSDDKAIVSIELKDLGVVRQGMNDGVVWQIHPTNGPKIFTGEEAETTKRTMKLAPETTLDGYAKAEVADVVELNGKPAYRMLCTTASGSTETRLYDIESGLLARTLAKLDSSVGELQVTTIFSDYEDAPPIRMPMKVQQQLTGMSPESVMTKVEHNVDLPDELFALPPEIVELQKHLTAKPAP